MIRKLSVITLLFFSIVSGVCAEQAQPREPKSAREAVIVGQKLKESGDFSLAIDYLSNATVLFPNSDPLFALYGEALYENNQMVEAEIAFRKALEINSNNTIAVRKIQAIRSISNVMVSEEQQFFQELTFDKLFDLIAMAMAFALGTVMSKYIKRIADWRFMRRSRRLFLKGDYDDFVDLIEIQLSTNELRPLRHSIEFMLLHMSRDEIMSMLNRYVNTEEHLQTLTRMVRLSDENQKPA